MMMMTVMRLSHGDDKEEKHEREMDSEAKNRMEKERSRIMWLVTTMLHRS